MVVGGGERLDEDVAVEAGEGRWAMDWPTGGGGGGEGEEGAATGWTGKAGPGGMEGCCCGGGETREVAEYGCCCSRCHCRGG